MITVSDAGISPPGGHPIPTNHKWSYNPYKWPKIHGQLGLFHPEISGVIGPYL